MPSVDFTGHLNALRRRWPGNSFVIETSQWYHEAYGEIISTTYRIFTSGADTCKGGVDITFTNHSDMISFIRWLRIGREVSNEDT